MTGTPQGSAEEQEIVAGISFSVVPRFELIPRVALLRLVRRAELGKRLKGKAAWNAMSDNQDALKSSEALIKRLGHAIDHATKLLERVIAGRPLIEPENDEDDAAALMWAGMYACCATDAIEQERKGSKANGEVRSEDNQGQCITSGETAHDDHGDVSAVHSQRGDDASGSSEECGQ